MKYNRKTEWRTHLGLTVTVEGMDDEHLANTVQFLTNYKNTRTPLLFRLLKTVLAEAKSRGLSKSFLECAPFPYRDGKGAWLIWDYENHEPKVIGSYLRGLNNNRK